MSARLSAAALALVAALAVAGPAPGQTGTEPLQELWSEYPLNPEPEDPGTQKDERLPLEAPRTGSPAAEPHGEEAGIPLALVLGGSLGTLALLALLAVARRPLALVLGASLGTLGLLTRRAVARRPPAPPAERPPGPGPAPPAGSRRGKPDGEDEVCVVCRWHGYVKSQYCAVALSPEGRERVVARSPEFRWWRDEPPPPSGAALAAHEALARLLEAEGWEREESEAGGLWEETTFRRPLAPSLGELADELAGGPRRSGSAG